MFCRLCCSGGWVPWGQACRAQACAQCITAGEHGVLMGYRPVQPTPPRSSLTWHAPAMASSSGQSLVPFVNPFVEAERAAQANQETVRGGRISTPRMRSDAQSFQSAMRRQVVTDTHELQETMLTNMITQAKQMQDMMNNLHQQLAIYEELFGQPRTPVHETEGSIADKGTQTDNYPSTQRIRRDM